MSSSSSSATAASLSTTDSLVNFLSERGVGFDGLVSYLKAFHAVGDDFREPDFVDNMSEIAEEYNISPEHLSALRQVHEEVLASSAAVDPSAPKGDEDKQHAATDRSPAGAATAPASWLRSHTVPPQDRAAAPAWTREVITGDSDLDRCNIITYSAAGTPPTDIPDDEVLWNFYIRSINPFLTEKFKGELIKHAVRGREHLLRQYTLDFTKVRDKFTPKMTSPLLSR